MPRRRPDIRPLPLATLLAALLLLLPLQTLAAWRVVPIRLDLSAQSRTGAVKVINEEGADLKLQLQAAVWGQDENGKDVYTPTEELIFFPRILTVPSGEERVIRAGIKLPATEREKTYRLFIEQIPEKGPTESAQVAIAIRFGVPVFSAPLKPAPAGHLEILDVDETLRLRVVNDGNVQLQLRTLQVTGFTGAGTNLFTETIQGWYLLTGISREYAIPLPAEKCAQASSLEIKVIADKLELVESLPLAAGRCGR